MTFFKKSCRISPADKWFSIYVRLDEADEYGYCICITCGMRHFWRTPDKKMTCGHFQKRHHAGTRFNRQNCGAQCSICNGTKDGEQYKHGKYIDKKYGEGTADKLVALAWGHGIVHKHDEKALAAYYRKKAREIAKQKGLSI